MIGSEWVNITFADRDAHGPVDCLAIFKLRHDNEHATEGQSQPSGDMEQEDKQQKRGEINKKNVAVRQIKNENINM